MKLKDLIEKYGEYDVVLSKREATNEIMIEGRKSKPKKVWDLKDGDGFYCLCSNGTILYYIYASYNEREIENGNAFLTKEEAEQDIERRKVETLLLKHGGRRWAREGVNYRLGLQYNMIVICKDMYPLQGAIYFDLEQQAQKAIDEIGEDRIREALFEVR